MIHRIYFGMIESEPEGFGIYFPDFPGCVSAGDTLEELATMGQEALQFHIDGMVDAGDPIPEPSSPDPVTEQGLAPEAGLRGMLAIGVRIPDLPDRIPIELRSELVREIAERADLSAQAFDTRQFVESAVRNELDRLKKSV